MNVLEEVQKDLEMYKTKLTARKKNNPHSYDEIEKLERIISFLELLEELLTKE